MNDHFANPKASPVAGPDGLPAALSPQVPLTGAPLSTGPVLLAAGVVVTPEVLAQAFASALAQVLPRVTGSFTMPAAAKAKIAQPVCDEFDISRLRHAHQRRVPPLPDCLRLPGSLATRLPESEPV